MIDKIEKYASIFYKLAQLEIEVDPNVNIKVPKDPIYINHVIKINRESEVIQDSVDAGILAGNTSPHARSYSDNLKNQAVQLTRVVQSGGDPKQEQEIVRKLFQIYNYLEDHYIDYRWEPMEEIRESLTYIARNMPEIAKEQNIPVGPGTGPVAAI